MGEEDQKKIPLNVMSLSAGRKKNYHFLRYINVILPLECCCGLSCVLQKIHSNSNSDTYEWDYLDLESLQCDQVKVISA